MVILVVWLVHALCRVVDFCLVIDFGINENFWFDTVRHWIVKIGFALFILVLMRLKKFQIYLDKLN